MREHKCLLRKGRHTCKALQSDFDNGAHFEMFALFEVADDLESRRKGELSVMEMYKDCGLLYNEAISFRPSEEARRKGVDAARHVEGNKRSPEANLKRSLAQKGKPKGHGAKISATKQARKAQLVMR